MKVLFSPRAQAVLSDPKARKQLLDYLASRSSGVSDDKKPAEAPVLNVQIDGRPTEVQAVIW